MLITQWWGRKENGTDASASQEEKGEGDFQNFHEGLEIRQEEKVWEDTVGRNTQSRESSNNIKLQASVGIMAGR